MYFYVDLLNRVGNISHQNKTTTNQSRESKMEVLKKLIKSADAQQEAIAKKQNLLDRIEEYSSVNISGYNNYFEIAFTKSRKEKIVNLLNEFIKEDQATLEPIITKLNLISDLVKGE